MPEPVSRSQLSDTVTVFRVELKAGNLGFTRHYTPVGNPSCIVFLDLKKQG
jgi:6-phosphogluconolactonase (cycloisomerase 2 family)